MKDKMTLHFTYQELRLLYRAVDFALKADDKTRALSNKLLEAMMGIKPK